MRLIISFFIVIIFTFVGTFVLFVSVCFDSAMVDVTVDARHYKNTTPVSYTNVVLLHISKL